MNNALFLEPLAGGVLIGIAITLLLLWQGRVAGVSGILNGALTKPTKENSWRYWFLAGLLVGGFLLRVLLPEAFSGAFTDASGRGWISLVIAGLLVGFGTAIGGGCTSGHGICGISRLSKRSILATIVFMIFGMLMATAFRVIFLAPPGAQ